MQQKVQYSPEHDLLGWRFVVLALGGSRMERRLATILAADIAGYSQLMSADEELITQRLSRVREIFFNRVIEASGKVFGEAGDGFIAEFASPVKAVQCAVEIQRDLASENRDIASEKKMLFRIGVHLADVIVENDTLLGDGVNIAARIEASGEPGRVHVSAQVFDQVGEKLGLSFDCLGPQSFKNIDRSITVYAVAGELGANRSGSSLRNEDTAPSLPAKPSIAVLPFVNMSEDSEQEYFADGITEDIITALSCWKFLPVISRSSSFAFKDQQVSIGEISRQLGAQYIVEGSVRTSDNGVRISAQLIDTESDHHLWAERYDRDLSDVFAVQEEIAFRVASAVEPAAIQSAAPKLLRRPNSTDAWGCVLRGWWYLWKMNNLAAAKAEKWFQQAIDRDPLWSAGYTGLAAVGVYSLFLGDQSLKIGAVAKIEKAANKAISLDNSDAFAHLHVGICASYKRETDKALWSVDRALTLNPSLAMAHYCKGIVHIYGGRPKVGLLPVQNAIQLSPHDPFLPMWILDLGTAHYLLGQHDQAIAECEKVLQMRPRWTAAMALTAANLSRLGQRQKAGDIFENVKDIIPNFDLNRLRAPFHLVEKDFKMLEKDLRLAGWG